MYCVHSPLELEVATFIYTYIISYCALLLKPQRSGNVQLNLESRAEKAKSL